MNDFRDYIAHHGIKGQKWGVRNGPPYPLDASDHNARERKADWKSSLSVSSRKKIKNAEKVVKRGARKAKKVAKETGEKIKTNAKAASVEFNKTASKANAELKKVANLTKKKATEISDTISKNRAIAEKKRIAKENKEISRLQEKYGISRGDAAELNDKQKKLIKAALIATGAVAAVTLGYAAYKTIGQKYFDTVLKTGQKVHTLSGNKVNLGRGYIYEAHTKMDRATYKGYFGGDSKFKKLDTAFKVKQDIKIASEKSSANIFKNLYHKDEEFRKYINSGIDLSNVKEKAKFNATYKSLVDFYEKNKGRNMSNKDLSRFFKLYNYTLPNTDLNSTLNRNKYFDALRKAGYGGIIDTNDSTYGWFNTRQSNILFDMPKLAQESSRRLKLSEIYSNWALTTGRQFVERGGIAAGVGTGAYFWYDKEFQEALDKAIENNRK